MSDGTPRRPGSRSERHQQKRGRSSRGSNGAAPPPRAPAPTPPRAPAPPPMAPVTTRPQVAPPPVLETLRPAPPRRARRAGQKADRRGRRRKIVRILAPALAVLLIVAGGTYALSRRGGNKDDNAGKTRTQRTVLLQIPAPDKSMLVGALIATDPVTGRAAVMLLPGRVLAQLPGHGDETFGKALALGGAALAKDTLANMLGVLVDGTWTLSTDGLAKLVDAVNGVVVDVDVDVTRKDKRGTTEVLLKAGPKQTLDGASAVQFASFVASDEQEIARLTRFQAVLDGLLERFPDDGRALASLLPPAADSAVSFPGGALEEVLAALADSHRRDAVSPAVLPVTEVDAGGDQITYRVDTAQMQSVVDKDFAASVPARPFGEKNRVLVRNGVGTAGIAQSVTRKLNPAGFRVVGTGNAPTLDYKQTVVLVFSTSDEDVQVGQRVAEVLGLTEDAVRLSNIDQTVADVIVIVGADYKQ